MSARERLSARPSILSLGCLVAAISVLAIHIWHVDPNTRDFGRFYEGSVALRTHQPMYATARSEYGNINPPTVALLLLPLSYVSLPSAFRMFELFGLLSIAGGVGAARRRLGLSWSNCCWLGVALVVGYPAAMAWTQGQLQLLLFYPFVRAWRSLPSRASGLWLGLAIAIKPPLALMAILLPWTVLLGVAMSGAVITAVAAALTGLAPWRDWLRLGHTVSWIGIPENASLWGALARATGHADTPWRMADAPWLAVVFVAIALMAWRTRTLRDSSRYVGALLWHMLVSPVGWMSYLMLAACPALDSWPGGWTAWAGGVLVMIPWALRPLASRIGGTFLAGSLGVMGVMLLWIAWSRTPTASRHA